MRLAVRSKVTHNYPGKTIWSSIKLALEHGSVHIWLKEVLLKAPMSAEGAVPCIRDGYYDGSRELCEEGGTPLCYACGICKHD